MPQVFKIGSYEERVVNLTIRSYQQIGICGG